ncbi:hypothetical protein LINPERPRIM_LOCUS64, partial [Linum perenne]
QLKKLVGPNIRARDQIGILTNRMNPSFTAMVFPSILLNQGSNRAIGRG